MNDDVGQPSLPGTSRQDDVDGIAGGSLYSPQQRRGSVRGESIGAGCEHRRLDPHLRRRLGTVQPHDVAIPGVHHSSSDCLVPLRARQPGLFKRHQASMSTRIPVDTLKIHTQWMRARSAGPEKQFADPAIWAPRPPNCRQWALESGAQIESGRRLGADLGATVGDRRWSSQWAGAQIVEEVSRRAETAGLGVSAGSGGNSRWSGHRKQCARSWPYRR